MGELKQLSDEQATLVARVKSAGQQVYLANLGLVSKVEEEGRKQLDRLVSAGEKVLGEQAATTARPVLAVYGLADLVKEEATKLFEELVAAGEKRKTH